MFKRSIWTGRQLDSLVEVKMNSEGQLKSVFVETEHKEAAIAYLRFVEKWKNVFLVAILSLGGLIAALALMAPVWTLGCGLILVAAVLAVLPLPTPQTIQLLGIKNSIVLVRVVAALIAVLGAWIAFA